MSKDEYLITDAPLKALTVSLLVPPRLRLSVPVLRCPMFLFAWRWVPVWVPVCW